MIERLMSKVEKTATCWLWRGATSGRGYGWIGVGGNTRSVHRVAHELLVGPIPKGMNVCHTCDVRHCVNPAHLFLGTRSDNMRDMLAKGRGNKASGESMGMTEGSRSHVDAELSRLVREYLEAEDQEIKAIGMQEAAWSEAKNVARAELRRQTQVSPHEEMG